MKRDFLISSSPSTPHSTSPLIQLAVLEELADGVLSSSVAPEPPSHPRTFSPDASKVVAGDAVVAGGHGAGIAVGAGRIGVVRIQPMALAQ